MSMWSNNILENYTVQIRDVSNRTDLSDHERYCEIFELVREIHCNSRMAGVKECKELILRTIRNEI